MRRLAVGGRDRGHGEWASDGCGRGHSGGRRVWWARDFSGSLEERWKKDGGGVICGRERLSERGPEMKECGTSRGRRGRGRGASRLCKCRSPLALVPQESKSQAGKTCKLFLLVAETHAARHPEVITATAGRLSNTAVPPRL